MEALKKDALFQASYDALSHDAGKVDAAATQRCVHSGGSCSTKWGTASPCCTATSLSDWKPYQSTIDDNLAAGKKASGGGSTLWLKEVLVIDGPTLVKMTLDAVFPVFVPARCANEGDVRALEAYESKQCMQGSPALKECDFELHP